MNIENLILVNYCHPDCVPLKNIMRLPKEDAFAMAKKMAAAHPETTAFYRFADFENYYDLRLRQDEFLYSRFVEFGGEPDENHPLSFVIEELNGDRTSILNRFFLSFLAKRKKNAQHVRTKTFIVV